MKASGEQNAINDIAWCPDNATIFAAVTADAKLQIWDLNASSIDPVVTLDTMLDDFLGIEQEDKHLGHHVEDVISSTDSAAVSNDTPGLLHNRPRLPGGRNNIPQADLYAPVAQLLKNLSQTVPKRSLTCLQLGEKYVQTKLNMFSYPACSALQVFLPCHAFPLLTILLMSSHSTICHLSCDC